MTMNNSYKPFLWYLSEENKVSDIAEHSYDEDKDINYFIMHGIKYAFLECNILLKRTHTFTKVKREAHDEDVP